MAHSKFIFTNNLSSHTRQIILPHAIQMNTNLKHTIHCCFKYMHYHYIRKLKPQRDKHSHSNNKKNGCT
jgi:hypothetical protein